MLSSFVQNIVKVQIAYGLCSSVQTFPGRLEVMTQWWQPGMSGAVFVDTMPEGYDRQDVPKGLEVAISSRPWAFVSEAERCAWSQITDLYRKFPQSDWFVIGDDDTLFVPEAVELYLRSLPASKKWYIGAPSESISQRELYGNLVLSDGEVMKDFAFGGGGIIISRALMVEMAQQMPQCLHNYSGLFGSDQRIAVCAHHAGGTLSQNQGMHQCDLVSTNIASMLEAHPLTPLLSLHHMSNVHLPQGTTLMDVRGAIRRNPFGALQQSVCIASAGLFSISSGLSVRWWPARTFISLFDLLDATQQHKLSSDTMARFSYSANLSESEANGISDTLQTIYTSSDRPHSDSLMINHIIVEEPVSSKRWKGAHRLKCLAVKEGLQDHNIRIILSDS